MTVGVLVLLAGALGTWRPSMREGGLGLFDEPLPTIDFTPLPQPTLPPATPPQPPPVGPDLSWLLPVVVALVSAALLVVAVLLLRRYLVRRPGPAAEEVLAGDALDGLDESALPAMRTGVAEASRVLRVAAPPGDAIVAAWVELERSAAATGLVREPAVTATEFTVTVLGATQADPAATRVLLDLYLAARFSRRTLAEADVHRAQQALATLADGLARSRPTRDDDQGPGPGGAP